MADTFRKYDIAVVGLGYVGLTVSAVMAEVGFKVIGIEKRPEIVSLTNNGIPHFVETGLQEVLERVIERKKFVASEQLPSNVYCDTYIITVGTPLDKNGRIRLDMISEAAQQVAEHMRPNSLVILRSTVQIGTTRNVVGPILSVSGKPFAMAMCPERTLEGRALQELRELPQIVGADTQEARNRASSVFQSLTHSIIQVSSLETAETVKLVDNTYRDVHFAFSNEVARACEAFGVSAYEVINSGKLGYARTNTAQPGLVGGPCLEKDPHILLQSASAFGLDLEITRASRLVNERQPQETVDFIVAECRRRELCGRPIVAIMGMAFKGIPPTDDLRGSMAVKVLAALESASEQFVVRLFDPVVNVDDMKLRFPGRVICGSIDEAITGADVVVITNNHRDLARHTPPTVVAKMNENGFIYDYWNHFSSLSEAERGSSYFAVGNTRKTAV